MRKYIMMFLLTMLVTISACTTQTQTQTPPQATEITSFEECVEAGNPVMESFPRQCSVNGETFVEEVELEDDVYVCTDEEKAAEMCTFEYAPVCGDDGVTYGNDCHACASGEIDTYTQGECETEQETDSEEITIAELEMHNTEEDCYVVYENNVYDVTAFLSEHPGGSSGISQFCGTTEFEEGFLQQHGTSKVETMMQETELIGSFKN